MITILTVLAVSAAQATATQVPHVAFVVDRSDGIERGDGAACGAVRTLLGRTFERGHPLSVAWRAGASRLSILGTADAVSGGTLEILSTTLPTRGPRALDEPETTRQKQRLAQSAFLKAATDACLARAQPQKTSPIYSGVRTAVQWLKNQIGGSDSSGLLIIQSDLQETHEKALVDALKEARRPTGRPPDAALRLDLGGRISVYACGLGDTSDRSQAMDREIIKTVWQKGVFANAQSVTIVDHCDGYQPTRVN